MGSCFVAWTGHIDCVFCFLYGVIDNERHVDEMEGESTPPPQEQGVLTCEHVKPKPPGEKPKSRSLPKKTKLEKSLEVLCDKMVSSSASEMDRYFTF